MALTKKKNKEETTNLKLGKSFFTSSQWLEYKEWKKLQEKPINKPKKKPINKSKKKPSKKSKEGIEYYIKQHEEHIKKLEKKIEKHKKQIESLKINNESNAYAKLLSSPLWKKRRKEIFELKGYECSQCHSKECLVVHHLYYEKDNKGKLKKPWDYPDDALVVLCKDCHNKLHGFKKG